MWAEDEEKKSFYNSLRSGRKDEGIFEIQVFSERSRTEKIWVRPVITELRPLDAEAARGHMEYKKPAKKY